MIYFIQRNSDKKIKIGKTNRPKPRFLDLVLQHGKMTGLGYVEGYTTEELYFHEKFSHLRIGKTEFFNPDKSLISFIENNTKPLNMGITKHTENMCCVELSPGLFCRKKKYFDLDYCKKHAEERGITNIKQKAQIVAIVSEDVEQQLKSLAAKNNNSLAEELRNAISLYLEQQRKLEKPA